MDSKYVYVDGSFSRNSAIIGKITKYTSVRSLLNLDVPALENIEYFPKVIANKDISKYFSCYPEAQ